jgi:predicted dehydrogenase
VSAVACDLQATVPGRRLDDNAQMLLRFAGGARGGLWASQVAVGHENGLRLRVYGETAGLEWRQEEPNALRVSRLGEAPRIVTRASVSARPEAARVTRIPGGHPEGYLEAFATIYTEAARAIAARRTGAAASADVQFPDIAEGVRGMSFVEAAIRSGKSDARWTPLET